MIEIEDLLGKPYKAHGRGEGGYDCYGLVIEVEKRFGHELPDLFYEYNGENAGELVDGNYLEIAKKCGAVEVKEPEEGDVLIFENKDKQGSHIGVYLGERKFIHCNMRGVNVVNIDRFFYKWRAYSWQK